MFDKFFDLQTIPFYLLGIVVFIISIIDDLVTTKKSFWWYLQDFLFSMVAVSIGISCCYLFDLPYAARWIVVIGCGIIGSTVIRKIDANKEKLSDKTIDRVAEATIKKIENKLNPDSEINNSENSEINNEENDENIVL